MIIFSFTCRKMWAPPHTHTLPKGSFCLASEADGCVWLCSSELRRVVLFKNQYELWRESSLLVAQCKGFIVSYSKEGNHRRQFQEIFQEFFFWGNTLHLTIGADEKKNAHIGHSQNKWWEGKCKESYEKCQFLMKNCILTVLCACSPYICIL